MEPAGVPSRHLVLAGGGHTHALVLRRWVMRGPPPDTLITMVSRAGTALYSGMVPGLIAGLYRREDCAIDLRRLCVLAGVGFVRAEITGLDAAAGELRLAGRPPLRWDLLSLDVGAVTPGPAGPGEIPVKPLEPFLEWSEARDPKWPAVVLGGGAAGVEVALALRGRQRREAAAPQDCPPELRVRAAGLRLGSAAADRLGERLLLEAGVMLRREAGGGGGRAVVRCTGSRAPLWLAASDLPCDPQTGRVLTEASLRVEGLETVFACGDCALIRATPRPPSGVWAVRAAPVLAENLRRSLDPAGPPLRCWRPQRRALQLLGDGGGRDGVPRAVAFWGPLALGPSRWLWRWKQGIDRRFMDGFTALAPMPGVMACRGCAAKLAADPLERALMRLGGEGAEDAVIVGSTGGGDRLLQSVDGFPALVADPWLNGRLTTLHACSDLWACGARVESVQALVTLPRLEERLQEELLLQTLTGVRSVLEPLGARLLGGHTLQQVEGGRQLSLALMVNGRAPAGRFWAKGALNPGDALLLSRPIGTGVLFAAAMAAVARAESIDAALELMQGSQAPLVEILAAHGCNACTDITGFGLLGHLGEMLRGAPQPCTVLLDPAAVPVLPGVGELLRGGIASTLAPANRRAWDLLETGRVQLVGSDDPARDPLGDPALQRELLIDPQTSGPLLAALPAGRAAAALAAVRAAGFPAAALIGRVSGC
jgi:selenide,water dikinase